MIHLVNGVDATRVEQDPFSERRLPGVDVSRDADIAHEANVPGGVGGARRRRRAQMPRCGHQCARQRTVPAELAQPRNKQHGASH